MIKETWEQLRPVSSNRPAQELCDFLDQVSLWAARVREGVTQDAAKSLPMHVLGTLKSGTLWWKVIEEEGRCNRKMNYLEVFCFVAPRMVTYERASRKKAQLQRRMQGNPAPTVTPDPARKVRNLQAPLQEPPPEVPSTGVEVNAMSKQGSGNSGYTCPHCKKQGVVKLHLRLKSFYAVRGLPSPGRPSPSPCGLLSCTRSTSRRPLTSTLSPSPQ